MQNAKSLRLKYMLYLIMACSGHNHVFLLSYAKQANYQKLPKLLQ